MGYRTDCDESTTIVHAANVSRSNDWVDTGTAVRARSMWKVQRQHPLIGQRDREQRNTNGNIQALMQTLM